MFYKFRSPNSPSFTIDIIKENRLYCADWRNLNDPMEGTYDALVLGPNAHRRTKIEEIYENKIGTRVCSLSRTYKHHPMWAYYAGDYSGLAIEIDLPESQVRSIDYASGYRIQNWSNDDNAYSIAQRILTTKHSDWSHEKEVRILYNEGEFFPLPRGAIQRIILGSRSNEIFANQVRNAADMAGITVLELYGRHGELYAR